MKAYHDGLIPIVPSRPSKMAPGDIEGMVLGAMFMMVAEMVDKPWSYVEKFMKEHRFKLAEVGRRGGE
jgi:hypothetical protein